MRAIDDFVKRRLQCSRGLRDESGITFIELSIALTAGLVIFGSIAALMVMTIRQTGRVTSHVEANQRARTTMIKMVNELHSACFFPRVTPIQAGSGNNKLVFWHQSGKAVAPVPVQSTIELVNGDLVERDAKALPESVGGTAWSFGLAGPDETLMKGISPLEGSEAIFTYYAYSEGKIASTPLATPLEAGTAGKAVQVNIAFKSMPEPPVVEDEGAGTGITDSVLLRLTPPDYSTSNDNPPCE